MSRGMGVIRGVLVAAMAVGVSMSASAEKVFCVYGHTGAVETYDTSSKAFGDFGGTPTQVYVSNGVTFNLFYEDVLDNTNNGFDDPTDGAAARSAVEAALDIVSDSLNETGTLDIHFENSIFTGTTFLATAGTFFSSSGTQGGSAQQRLLSGSKPFAGFPEIQSQVDFSFNWNFTTNPPAFAEFDFISVMVHEITHGLGVLALTTSTGASSIGTARSTFQTFITRSEGGSNLWTPNFTGSAGDLTSQDLFFEGTNAIAGYDQGGTDPGIYAPSSFSSGSSISHWDTGNIVGGAVMEHAISNGEAQRNYAPMEIGALIDIGWTNAADPNATAEGEGEGTPEGEGEGTPEGEGEGTSEGEATVSITGASGIYEEGSDISLTASLSSGSAVSYQWKKDGGNIGGATGSTFEIIDAQASDSGVYRVQVDTGSKAVIQSPNVEITVVPVGALPVGGMVGMAALAAACAIGGMAGVRRRS